MKWPLLPFVILGVASGIKIPTNGETVKPADLSDVVIHIHKTMVGGGHNDGSDGGVASTININQVVGLGAALVDAGSFTVTYPACTLPEVLTSDGGVVYCTTVNVDEAESEKQVIKFVANSSVSGAANWIGNDNQHTAASTCTAPAPNTADSATYKAAIIPYITPGGGGTCAVVVSLSTAPAYRPKYTSWIKTGSSVAYYSVQAALEETNAFTVREVAQGADAGTNDYIGIGMDSALNGGQWVCCSGDGTLESCSLYGGTLAANTVYELGLDWSTNSSSFTCSVNGVAQTKSTNVSTNFVNLRMRLQHGASMFNNPDGGSNGNITSSYRYMIMSHGESMTIPF